MKEKQEGDIETSVEEEEEEGEEEKAWRGGE